MSRRGGGVPPQHGGRVLLALVAVVVSACSASEDPSDVSLGTLGASTTAAPETSAAGSSPTTVTTSPATATSEITTTVGSTTSSPPQDASGAVGAWSTFWASLPDRRPNGPLPGPATPEVKQQVAAYVSRPEGSNLPTEVQSNPVTTETGDAVTITDCVVSQPSLSGSPDQAGLLVEGTVERRPNGWRVTSVTLPENRTPCVPGGLVPEPRDLWIRDLELELGLPESLPEMGEVESEDLFAQTTRYADSIEETGSSYQGERELHPVVSAFSFEEEGRMVITFRSCHTYSDDFGVVAGGEMLTDLYDPERRRSDVGEVTRFEDGWLVTSVEGSRRPCEPGDDAIAVVGA